MTSPGEEKPPPSACKPIHKVDKPKKLIWVGPGEGHSHTASVLVLHGFGDTAAGWFEPAMWWAERLPHVRFVLPTAPVSPAMGACSWFDFGGKRKEETLAGSVKVLQELIEQEERVVGTGRIVIAGFSQGGFLAYHLGLLRSGAQLAGVIALSTWLPTDVEAGISENTKQTPVLICHGTEDDRIPGGPQGAERARDRLARQGAQNVELKIYQGMGHSACDIELLDVLNWLQRAVPVTAPQARL